MSASPKSSGSQSPKKEDMVEYFINYFPNLDPSLVSGVVQSDEMNGNKKAIEESLLAMGGMPADGSGYDIAEGEQADIDEIQNFVMDSNEHVAAIISGIQRPENFDKSLVETLQKDIKEAESLLQSPKLHPMSRDSLETLVREATDVLQLYGGISTEDGSISGMGITQADIDLRMGADPQELERLREALHKAQAETKQLQHNYDKMLLEKEQAIQAVKEKMASMAPAPVVDTKEKDKTIADLKAENLKLRDSCATFVSHAKRMIHRVRENAASAKDIFKEERTRMTEDMKTCAVTIGHLKKSEMMEKLYKKMETMYKEEVALRKSYYNTIQELRGNIRVFARVRPLIGIEKDKGQIETCCEFDKNDPEVMTVADGRGNKKYTFNKVFNPDCSQEDVFVDTLPLINSVVDGYNVCIFAYGQTGSGKTWTMEGPSPDEVKDKGSWKNLRGVNRRAIDRMYEIVSERSESEETSIYVSVLEIYCEKVRDLLSKESSKKKFNKDDKDEYKVRTGLHVVGEYEVPGNYVEGLTQIKVNSPEEVTNLLDQAKANRREGKTDMNTHSSRSHMILSLVVCSKNIATGTESFGKLNLIDLAGSERLAKTNATGQTAEEAKNINQSLSCLSKVIYDLQQGSKHVNYRDSKLTHLLQDSLGGNSKVLMFANCSPASSNSSETKSTLEMASRAMKCSLGKASKNKISK